jgi:hypothetical protein
MNRRALIYAGAVAALCAAAIATLATWPVTDPISWRPLSSPAWWQFEWLAYFGVLLSAAPSFVIYKFDAFFAANEHLRIPFATFLVFAEVLFLAFGTYKLLAFSADVAAKAQQAAAGDARNART